MHPRAQLLLIGALFMLPIAASVVTYKFFRPDATANRGELLLPPAPVGDRVFERPGGGEFRFGELAGKWIMATSDSGACGEACRAKLVAMRQVRLALGRDASRVARVFIIDDLESPAEGLAAEHPGLEVALTPKGASPPPGVANDRAHVYLVDPRGNVMMRWPATMESKAILSDLKRLLKASQIG
jgi:hypothetical protein